jgi:iron(III) transport system permease protein
LLVPVLGASAVIVLLLVFVIYVSFAHFENGLLAGFAGGANYESFLQSPLLLPAVQNTFVFTLVTLAVSLFYGVPLAWLTERTDLPGRALIWTAMLASVVMPSFMIAMGWLFLAHPRIGVLNVILMWALHLDHGPLSVTSASGMGTIEGIALAPLVFILTAPSMRTIDPALEEAGMIGGGSSWQVMRRVTLPLLAPALFAAIIFTGITAVGAFDIPAVIGLSNRVYTFSTLLYQLSYPVTGFPDYGATAAGGAALIAIALALSVLYARVLKQARQYQTVTGKAYRPRLAHLGGWAWLAWLFVGSYIVMVLILPFLVSAMFALLPYAEAITPAVFAQFSFANFTSLPWDLVARGALHTLEVAAVVPLCVVALSMAFSWIVLRTKLPGRLWFDSIAFLPQAVPGVLFALSATLLALFVLRHVIPIYGTIAMLMIVYTVAWLSLGTRMINSSLIQIHQELEEAALMAGASFQQGFRRITFPLLRPATSGLWIFAVLLAVRELNMAAFVTTPQNATLPMVSLALWIGGSLTQAAAVAVMIVLVLGPLLFVYLRFAAKAENMFR